mmetsp:Transcript_9405/g.22940  ORF Transcript_9405/g.22940 Transcript_9405/m.22940 type:complete len:229 (+) Transcript_9405:638-1324(+)
MALFNLFASSPVSVKIGVVSSSTSPANRSLDVFIDIALSSAKRSASSAEPPRSPLNVLGKLDLMPMFSSLDVAASASLSGAVIFGKKASSLSSSSSALTSEGVGTCGAEITTSTMLFAAGFFVATFRFHGGRDFEDASFWTSLGFFRGFSSKLFRSTNFGASVSSFSPSKRLVDDLIDMARSSASKSASSALPPRSPLNVCGRFDLIPILSSFDSFGEAVALGPLSGS